MISFNTQAQKAGTAIKKINKEFKILSVYGKYLALSLSSGSVEMLLRGNICCSRWDAVFGFGCGPVLASSGLLSKG